MEEVATCSGCGSQYAWIIYRDRIECSKCHKEYRFGVSENKDEEAKASDLVSLVNTNL